MKKQGSSPDRSQSAARGSNIGRDRFAKISAVEGIKLTPAMRKRAAEFDRKRLSPEQRIRAIIAAHRKG